MTNHEPVGEFVITLEPIEDVVERRYRLRVVVYRTLNEMRGAGRKYHPKAGPHLNDAGGCFQIAPGVRAGRAYLGTMRLARELLNPWVVMHEAVHVGVALAFAECNRKRVENGLKAQPISLDPYLGGGWADREELIAYGAHGFGYGILAELGLINHEPDQTGDTE